IWQQNLNTSRDAQTAFLNSLNPNDWDILVLQEPHINSVNNILSTWRYHAVYPTLRHLGPTQKSRAATLVSTSIDCNTWTQLPFPSRDVITIQLTGSYGRCTILNIYNNGTTQTTLEALTTYLEANILQIQAAENDYILWLSDFNRHHPLWEEERNAHLLTNQYLADAQPLIELLVDYGMAMALPKDMPTLEALATKNWTRPDNVFCSTNATESVGNQPTIPYFYYAHCTLHFTSHLPF
ncbi:DNase I-like protein, partial [Paxillus ammoniavirescens]